MLDIRLIRKDREAIEAKLKDKRPPDRPFPTSVNSII